MTRPDAAADVAQRSIDLAERTRNIDLAERTGSVDLAERTRNIVELQRSNEELEQFAGAVSHDLVRPMAAAHGYLELLSERYAEALGPPGGQWLASAARGRMHAAVGGRTAHIRPRRPGPVPA